MRPKNMFLVLCIAFLMECIAVSASCPEGLCLDVSPPNMHQGFTKHLAVNCTFDKSLAPNFGTLITLIVSKETGTPGVFNDVSSISTYSHDQVEVKDNLGADVKGRLSASGVSFISYEWDQPTSDVEGNYRCEALGMDQLGHPKTISDTANIEEKMVDLSMALDKINELKVLLYQCQQQKGNESIVVEDCSPVKENLTIVTDELNQCKNLTSKAADCERDVINKDILINECGNDKNKLTVELSNLKDKENNLTTLFSACNADRANLSTSIDKCNHDLRDKELVITQSINDTTQLNAKLSVCSQDKNNLTTTLNECENKEIMQSMELDHCRNDINNVSSLLNECKLHHQDINTTSNNNLIELGKCQQALTVANMTTLNCAKDLTTLQQQHANTSRLMAIYISENDLLKSAFIKATFEKTSGYLNGHVYYLSHSVAANLTHSHHTCLSLGGTLAEINSEFEYNFVNTFCRNSGVHDPTKVMLGATDLDASAGWTYYSSDLPVTFTKWAPGQPNGAVFENCMYLYWGHGNDMHDGHCYSKHEATRFVCEVPQVL